MTRLAGPVRQIGLVVTDIDAAITHYTDILGIGPFCLFRELRFDDDYFYMASARRPRSCRSPWATPTGHRSKSYSSTTMHPVSMQTSSRQAATGFSTCPPGSRTRTSMKPRASG